MTINKGEPLGLKTFKELGLIGLKGGSSTGNLSCRNDLRRHFMRKDFTFEVKVKDLSSMRLV